MKMTAKAGKPSTANTADAPDLPHDTSVYSERRARIAQALAAAGGGIALLPTAPEMPRNRDSDFAYRHDSYFYYLTGFTEPGSWLSIDSCGKSTLFCRPKDLEREIWDGIRLGPKDAVQALGVDDAFSLELLADKMPTLLANQNAVWFPFATHKGLETQVDGWLNTVRARVRMGAECPQSQHDLCRLLDEMRLVKDAHEIAILRRAGAISAGAHVRAMQTSAAMLRAVNVAGGEAPREYHLEAELLHEFRRHGAQGVAYTSIVAAGANACILHYRADTSELKKNELCLIDAGCELDGYASDITRTFPANGQFTPAQRLLYDIVLAAQEAAIKVTKPGKRFSDPHDAATRVLAQGMLDVGLLNPAKHGSVDDVLASGAYRQFYMHRTSHWMGMDVHDCGDYTEPGSQAREEKDALGQLVMKKPSRILRAGMVLTIEPGIYVRPAKGVPKQFWNIGIRIEDDALVTAKGCELLTRGVPVKADAIEALMRG